MYGVVSEGTELYITAGSGFLVRSFDPEYTGPKWMKVGYFSHFTATCDYLGTYFTKKAVITEDPISAIKCARMWDSYALCGLSVTPELLAVLLDRGYDEVVVFLDDDNTKVRQQAVRVKDKVSLFTKSRVQRSGTDPKNLDVSELRRLLC